jgi:hypothetical protein
LHGRVPAMCLVQAACTILARARHALKIGISGLELQINKFKIEFIQLWF